MSPRSPMPQIAPLLALLLLIPASALAHDLDVGGDVRVRGYSLANMWDADDADDRDRWSVMRHRARVHLGADLDRGVRAYVRLANQHFGEGVTEAVRGRSFVDVNGDTVSVADRWEADNKSDKVFVDAAWIDVDDLFGLPCDLRVGRQHVRYGSGFVLFDGQSQTASTSAYQDGVRARFELADAADLDLLYFKDQENARDDESFDDLTSGGAYLSWRGDGVFAEREAYVLRRCDQTNCKKVMLYGLRTAGSRGALDWDLEGGIQRGFLGTDGIHPEGRRDREAWGCKTEIGLAPAGAPLGARLFAGFVGLSGDDPATPGVVERWDVFHGGWPQFGDLLAWTNLNLGPANAVSGFDPGYAEGSSTVGEVVYGNLLMPTLGLELAPRTDTRATLSWSPLRAHRVAAGSDEIGDYWQLGLRHRYSDELTFAVYAALLDPGAAYGPDADPIHEIFWESNLRF